MLDALAIMQSREKRLTGVVEAGEMLLNIFYKVIHPYILASSDVSYFPAHRLMLNFT